MRDLFKSLTTKENLINFARTIILFGILATLIQLAKQFAQKVGY